jgi:CXXX repeat radical SAM target protein
MKSKMDRRGFLKTGSQALPALAVLGIALFTPLQARADCSKDCTSECKGTCWAACNSTCSGTCHGNCEGSR